MQKSAAKSKTIHFNWINKDRVPNPGTWFTTKDLAYGGVSRDLMPHLLSLYIALNPDWNKGKVTNNTGYQRWTLNQLSGSDYGTVKADGIYNVDDCVAVTFDSKWTLTANWRDTVADNRKIVCDTTEFELGLCPESAYKAMVQDAFANELNNDFWQNQYVQDMWIHTIIEQLWK
jgi:predicted dehydrogenase